MECSISGKVQGVGFRRFILARALEYGVVGYVCNTEEGAVEVVAQGKREVLESLLAHLQKGSIHAQVDDIEVRWHETLQDSLTDFTIR